jgi:hypothetical protein
MGSSWASTYRGKSILKKLLAVVAFAIALTNEKGGPCGPPSLFGRPTATSACRD